MELIECKEDNFQAASCLLSRKTFVVRIRALYFTIGDRGQFNKIPSGNIRTWNQAEGEEESCEGRKKGKKGNGIMERRNSRLVDPNYSLRSILTIHRSSCGKSSFLVPRILRWLPMSEGDDCLRTVRGRRKGCRWRLKLTPAVGRLANFSARV